MSATLGGRGRKRVLAAQGGAGDFCGGEGSVGSPGPRPGCLLTDETVTVLKQFGQKDFKLRRDLTCIPVTFDMLILWK